MQLPESFDIAPTIRQLAAELEELAARLALVERNLTRLTARVEQALAQPEPAEPASGRKGGRAHG